jgi:hypothetical protein
MSNKLYYRDKKFWTIARNVAIGLMLLGGLILTLNFTTRQPKYEDMLRDTIIVQQVDYIRGYRGTGHYELKSIEGKYYNIEPRDAVRSMDKVVNDGVQVEITYYTTKFPVYNHISQMTDGETEFVTFHDYRTQDSIITAVVVLILELFGAVILWFGLWQRRNGHYTKEKTKEIKERARLKK